jgi:hypothetical protein
VPVVGDSFFCASGETHSTVTFDPGLSVPLTTFVVDVRLITHVSVPTCSVIWVLVTEETVPVIWIVCPNAALQKTQPAATTAIKLFSFMRAIKPPQRRRVQAFMRPLFFGAVAAAVAAAASPGFFTSPSQREP